MNKLQALRTAINVSNLGLRQNPDRLLVFTDKRKAVAAVETTLGFGYQFDAKVIVIDYPTRPSQQKMFEGLIKAR